MKPLLLISFLLPLWMTAQDRYAVVIDELMADPSPQTGLPNQEWIELKNVSPAAINLRDWRLADASGQSGPLPEFTLQPDSFVIICSANAAAALSSFGTTVPVTGFPALDNDGEIISLKNNDGMTMHAIAYSSAWYDNDLKKEGGWSLEMIDTNSPCSGYTNWKACSNLTGGTPGQKNSIAAAGTESPVPQLKSAFIKDPQLIVLVFNTSADSAVAATTANYSLDGGLVAANAVAIPPLFNQVELLLNAPMNDTIIYTITANNIQGCKNGTTGPASIVKVGTPAVPAPGELVINEILFNPRPNGYDYIEIYNNGNKIADASQLYVGNRNSSSVIADINVLSQLPIYIFPGDYAVVTEDAASLHLNYLVRQPAGLFIIPAMPSLPDEAGDVLLLNQQGEIIDEVTYAGSWHFPLIDNSEGVALERIDPAAASKQAANWHSAASTAGYGTPTYVNSQFKTLQTGGAMIAISPTVFSPDNDGRDDITTIQYQVREPGYVANITIFDSGGLPVRKLVRSSIMAPAGYWNWDGLNDNGIKLAAGAYIVLTEFFNLQGKKDTFRNAVFLVGRFH